MKIAYKKPRCPSLYEKLGTSNLYDWFVDRGKVKAKYAHLVELSTQVQTKKQNLPIVETYPIFRDSMVGMLQKMKEGGQPRTTFTIQPILCGMIEYLTLDVICDTKLGGFKITQN